MADKIFKTSAKSLKQLKVACIMDEFTLLSYMPECRLLELTPHGFKAEIDSFKPDMVFIESAWNGVNMLWTKKIARGSLELESLVKYCNKKGIPVVFWTKEDPVYYDAFLIAASLADYVFTTDIDCIPRYKSDLGHDKIYHLHFAAQPKTHNPIEYFPRKDRFCFAGAYYHKYQERSKIFDSFAPVFINSRGYDIYDRNYGKTTPDFLFPEIYKKYILGTLPYEEIDKAYKGYFYGVNMNSVTQSSTMFARRVFELIASNTIIVGNYSRGVKNYFGDLTICTDDAKTMLRRFEALWADDASLRKYRLLGLRNVLSNHLYENRLDYVCQKVFGKNLKSPMPTVAVIAKNTTSAINAYSRQTYENKELYIVSDIAIAGKNIITANMPVKNIAADYIAVFDNADYYGANYLTDLMLSTRYTDADGIGKSGHYIHDSKTTLIGENYRYCDVNMLSLRRSVTKKGLWGNATIGDLPPAIRGKFIAIDEFNYCADYRGQTCPAVDDTTADAGTLPDKLNQVAYSLTPPKAGKEPIMTIDIGELTKLFTPNLEKRGLSATQSEDKLLITTSLPDSSPEYIYFNSYYDIIKKGEAFYVTLYGTPHVGMQLIVVFYDKNRNRVFHLGQAARSPIEVQLNDPRLADVEYFRVALRMTGTRQYEFIDIKITDTPYSSQDVYIPRSKTLVLANRYPSYDNLYAYMFVHSRVMAYKHSGYICDVMQFTNNIEPVYREFEGINVIEGNAATLTTALEKNYIETVCVHFLSEQLFTPLKEHLANIRLLVWVHGAEIQPWWRREYNYADDTEREAAKTASDKRMAFWNEVFSLAPQYNIHFVFVSQYFADEVMEDYKIKLPKESYSIIHNTIDTETFNYVEKDVNQRKKIFSCRPFASRQYANDLSVKAILALSEHECFEDMAFHIAGSGKLFEETTAPLRHFKNVNLEERFYTHDEIAALHKDYGVCLIPTRWDSHGVSRDEAMSSGLIPVTSAVAAIPEFVDDDCGIVAQPEDWQGLADGILLLYNNPELFSRLSRSAAARVRFQSAKALVIEKELLLIKGAQ